ncbi:MAG: GntR family transcriptional regulator [Lachnospiraceae bacterium]|nr:GntR family transcriptional regulator [Lachnospiraceae bacterium]MBQ8233358.1 GntR family transcriptional regulator [Lachnospiraceae bacterium]
MIALDYRDKRPIYEQIVEKLEKLIVCGALESNTRMPSVRSLAMELSVNPNTIQRAYAQLEQDGYLYTIVGRGNYVTCEAEWKKGRVQTVLKEFTEVLTKARETRVPRGELMALFDRIYPEKEGENT